MEKRKKEQIIGAVIGALVMVLTLFGLIHNQFYSRVEGEKLEEEVKVVSVYQRHDVLRLTDEIRKLRKDISQLNERLAKLGY